jgi:hypothetical protein
VGGDPVTVGILAFGSILAHPGPELEGVQFDRIGGIETPFRVEFARSSQTRDGGPTLVPVNEGGAKIPAVVVVLDESVDEEHARDMLYRRESGKVGANVTYKQAKEAWIRALRDFAGVDVCLYTALTPNIQPLTAAHLAELAIRSAGAAAGAERRDGISYLNDEKRRGINTPLMPAYEREVLARTGARDLNQAWEKARSGTV